MTSGNRANIVLLVLLVIIGALGIVWFSAALRDAKRKSLRVQCISNMKQIGALCISYADDHDDYIPIDPSSRPRAYLALQTLVDGNPEFDSRVLISPAHYDDRAMPTATGTHTLGPANVSYAYRGAPTETNTRPDTILAGNDTYRGAPNEGARPEGHYGGVNVVMITGEARFIRADDWERDRSFPAGLVDNYGNTR